MKSSTRTRLLLSLCWSAFSVQALPTQEWQKQSIYFLMTDRFAKSAGESTETPCPERTYCGGTWQGVIDHLDYIQDMGFTAVWISPVVKNIEEETGAGFSYHGYWTEDIWSLNGHFGTEEDLVALSTELHARGMYLMVDVVVNHMAPTVPPASYTGEDWGGQLNYTTYKNLKPFNSSEYYHDPCFIDNGDPASVISCRINDAYVNLPDLKTEDPQIRATFQEWIADLVTKYGIDGLRVDTAKHVEKDFFPEFFEAAGVFAMAEIFDGDPASFPAWEDYVDGAVNYPAYYWLLRAFQSRTAWMDELVNGLGQMQNSSLVFGNFLENHDTSRFAHFSGDTAMSRNALALMMVGLDGMPVIYQGQEQHFSGAGDPNNREPLWKSGYNTDAELYQFISKLNTIRTAGLSVAEEATGASSVVFNNTHVIAMKKGSAITIATNVGTGGKESDIVLPQKATGVINGAHEFVDVLTCKTYTTTGNGSLIVTMGYEPKILYPAETLDAAGWPCRATGFNKPTCLVNFRVNATTVLGEMIKILGNVPELGAWANTSAVSLDPAEYPVWSQYIALEPGTELEYVYLKDNQYAHLGNITREPDSADGGAVTHTLTVPETCSNGGAIEVYSEWGATTDNDVVLLDIDIWGFDLEIVWELEDSFRPPKCRLGPPSTFWEFGEF